MARSNRIFQGLSPNTRYSVRVRAVSKFGVYSDWSEALDFTTPQDDSVPNAPSDLSVDFSTETLFLSWVAPATNTDGSFFNDFNNYRVELTSTGGNTVSYNTPTANFSYSFRQNRNDFGTAQSSFNVAIYVVDASNSDSDPLTGTAVNTAPPQPDPITGSPTPDGTTLILDPVGEDIDFSIIERATTSGGPFTEIAQTGETIYMDNLDDNLIYYYRYKTVDVFGQESPYSVEFQRNSAVLVGKQITVAASDAPEGWKKIADFVCDGSTDAQTIEDAINFGSSLPDSIAFDADFEPEDTSNGDPGFGVQFSPGTFRLEKAIDFFGPTVWEGIYGSTVLVRNYTTSENPALNGGSGFARPSVYNRHVLYRNLIFNGNNVQMKDNGHPDVDMMFMSSSGGHLQGCGFVNCANGLYVVSGALTIDDCWFDSCDLGLYDNNTSMNQQMIMTNTRFTGNGSCMYTLEGAVIDNCQFVFNEFYQYNSGFTFQGKNFGILTDSSSGILKITNSLFYENTFEFASIIVEDNQRFFIDNCTFQESRDTAESIITTIHPFGTGTISNSIFRQNLSSGTDDSAIRMWGEGVIDVKGCHFIVDDSTTNNVCVRLSKDPLSADPVAELFKVRVSECTFELGSGSTTAIISDVPSHLIENSNIFHQFLGSKYSLGVDTELIPEIFYSGIELPENFSQFVLTSPNGTKYNVSITDDGTLKAEGI